MSYIIIMSGQSPVSPGIFSVCCFRRKRRVMSELKERKDMDPRFQWDLTTLYKNDKDWENTLPRLDEKIAKAASYQGTLKDAETIKKYFDAETDLDLLLSDLFEYASLRKNEDNGADAGQKMYAKIYSKYVEAVSATAFAQPEILSLPEDVLKKYSEDVILKDYHYILVKLLRQKAHTLSADEEQLLAQFGEALGAPKEIANTLQDVDLSFHPAKDADGKSVEVTGSNYILLQSSDDRTLRENSFRSYYRGYRTHINTFAASYSGAVKAAVAEARVRHYTDSRAMSMAEENVPEQVYDNLVHSVRKHMSSMYRYVRLRKRLLGLDELHYYDLYAPLVRGNDKKYTYEEAQKMVLDTVAPFGAEYVNTVKKAFAERWIDVYPNKGKTGGAYSSGTYNSNPFILTNFTGTLDAVSTIAHEMGHSMHTWFSNHHQKPQNAEYTLFVAEVASTVNENLLVEKLLSETDDPKDRLTFLNQYLEAFKGTVYRQTMFAEFEQKAHELAEHGEALNATALNGIYGQLIRDYFGPDLVIDDEVQYEWARIPHFYRPFYVYKYATSYSAAVAISESVRNEGAPAVKRYLEFLSLGGSEDPIDELRHAGVDLTDEKPIDAALEKFEKIIEEAEKAADKLGM